jgi:hypothetical protein
MMSILTGIFRGVTVLFRVPPPLKVLIDNRRLFLYPKEAEKSVLHTCWFSLSLPLDRSHLSASGLLARQIMAGEGMV